MKRPIYLLAVLAIAAGTATAVAQEKSVRPGINDSFRDPDVGEFVERFEIESREVFAKRKEIVAACEIQTGQTVADIGAGTGLFTRLFAEAVGETGHVVAVDIAQKFLDHIASASREAGLKNVETVLCTADSTELPKDSIDVAFICDTYHHFEFPQKTLASLFAAMKPGGRVILIDFRRVEGESTDWVLNHVRAGQDVFEAEIVSAGFKKVGEEGELLQENYFVVFQKDAEPKEAAPTDNAARGPGRGRGRGMGRGMGPELRADQDVFHYLLQHRAKIRRSVTSLDNGVETLTESDDPDVAAKIQEHVASMQQRIEEGRGFRFWDELFAALFRNYDKIKMTVENTDKGVRVRETSDDAFVATLIQAHARVVSSFIDHGFDEVHKNHEVPDASAKPAAPAKSDATAKPAAANLQFPVVPKHGGVFPRTGAAEPPRAGAKVLFDATASAKPEEINKGVERAARLLNLYGSAGLQASDVQVAIVLHGEATRAALTDSAYLERYQVEKNPNLPLIEELRLAGVEVLVCGQALNHQGFADAEVAGGVSIAASAMTAVINKQAEGFAYLPIP